MGREQTPIGPPVYLGGMVPAPQAVVAPLPVVTAPPAALAVAPTVVRGIPVPTGSPPPLPPGVL